MFSRAATAVIQRADYFSELDMAGDADFGVSLSKGFEMAMGRLSREADPDIGRVLTMTGDTFSMEVGSTIGVIFGSALSEAGRAMNGRRTLDATGLADVIGSMLVAVKSSGGASLGDKTLIDSLEPAALAARRVAAEGKGFQLALLEAASSADEGSKSTIDMVARVGRASYLGERSRGREDPGAAFIAFFLRSMGEPAHR
jgi:phosphoenolpyruvate---glycerone phosphotransferase subunit DhaL